MPENMIEGSRNSLRDEIFGKITVPVVHASVIFSKLYDGVMPDEEVWALEGILSVAVVKMNDDMEDLLTFIQEHLGKIVIEYEDGKRKSVSLEKNEPETDTEG